MELTYQKWHPHPDAGPCPDCGGELGIIGEFESPAAVPRHHRGTIIGWKKRRERPPRIIADNVCPHCHRDEYEDVDWSMADGE